jgi:hypothetical protein
LATPTIAFLSAHVALASLQLAYRLAGMRDAGQLARSTAGQGSSIGGTERAVWERNQFDALTGKGTNPGNCQLTVFGTRVKDGKIEVLAPDPD